MSYTQYLFIIIFKGDVLPPLLFNVVVAVALGKSKQTGGTETEWNMSACCLYRQYNLLGQKLNAVKKNMTCKLAGLDLNAGKARYLCRILWTEATGWGCSRRGCCMRYMGLRRVGGTKEVSVMRSLRLCTSQQILSGRSRRMSWVEHVACTGQTRNAYRDFAGENRR